MRHALLNLAICLLPGLVLAQAFQWTTFTSTSNVVDLVESRDQHIWLATVGGLADFDPASGTFQDYSNTRGLAMNQCVAVADDAHGYIWAALSDARITRIDPRTGAVRQIVDLYRGVYEITQILRIGDEMFVASNNGIYRFSYRAIADNYRVLEIIKALGAFPAESRVTSLAVLQDTLYAGTGFGLARAALSQPQLSAPSAWQNFSVANSALPENSIGALGAGTDEMWIATAGYVVSLHHDRFESRSNLGGILGFAPGLAYSWGQIFRRTYADSLTSQWASLGTGFGHITGLIPLTDGRCAVGVGDNDQGRGGVSLFNPADAEPLFSPVASTPGIGGNFITTVGVDAEGRMWAGGGSSTAGVYVLNNGEWTNFTRDRGYTDRFFNGQPTDIVFDNGGGAWVSTLGQGVGWFHGDSIAFFNTWDSTGFAGTVGQQTPRLPGLSSAPQYVETYLARNAAGDVYIVNLEAGNGHALYRVPAPWIVAGNNPAPWNAYKPRGSGLPADYGDSRNVGRVIVDPFQRVWTGPGRNGYRMWVLDDRGTPADTSDDLWDYASPVDRRDPTTCFNDINISKEVLDWDIDAQGYLWVGTINGAYYCQGGIPADPTTQTRFICMVDLPVGRRVNAVHVDAQDNKWFGTDEGIAVLDKNFNWVHKFQTASSVDFPSGLVSNNVTSIASNPRTGEVWIGTTDGLSRYTSPYVSSGSGLSDVWPYPNPFRADGTQRLRLDPVRLGGRFDDLKIFTMSGRLVRKLSWSQMTEPAGGGWDGTNDDGELVAGGVYLIVVASSDGKSATGKIAVLGK